MANYKVSDSDLTSVANAIRTKGGASAGLSFPDGFVSAIGNIPTGGGTTLITKSITENGTYSASSDNADGYSSVTVNIPSMFKYEYTYTVTESWETDQTGGTMLAAVLDGHYKSNSMAYCLIFRNNANTSGYRIDAIICSKASSSSDLSNLSGWEYRNYFNGAASLGGTCRATAGTLVDLYVATIPS